jgi:uncharacterized membrane-anchored protein YjiN (DUF445 family)
VLRERLQVLEVARWGGVWLQRPGPSRRLAERVAAVLPHVVAAAPPGAVGALVGSMVKAAVQATPVAPTAGRLLEGLRREGRTEALIEWALRNLHDLLAEHRTAICEEAVAGSGWASRWLDRLVAGRVIDAAINTLSEMRDPEHRIRRRIRAAVIRWSRRLRSDAALQARAEAFKQDLLANPVVLARLADFEDLAEAGVLRGILAEQGSLAPRLEQAIRGFGRWLADNAPAQARLNTWARDLATGAIAPRRQQIGGYVAGVVSSWDAGLVTAKLELQVGRDLQYIRINGTLVGGLVGLAIFALARALGL